MRRSVLPALAAPIVLAFAPAPPAAPAGGGWPDFDAQVAAAKGAMMAEPQAALTASRAAMQVAAAKPASPDRDKAQATAGWLQGEALIRVNRPADAEPVLEAALKRAQAVAPGTKLEGDLLKARGSLSTSRGQVQPALLDFQQAFRVYQKANVPRSQAIVLQDIGSIYSDAHDYAHTASYYKQSAEIFRDDPAIALAAHNNLGGAYLGLHRDEDALREFTLALKLAREMNSATMLARVLPNLAQAQMRTGRADAAQGSLAEAFRVSASDPSAKAWTPFIWGMQAQLEEKRGRLPAARAALERTFAAQDLSRTDAQFREFHETAWRVYTALGEPPRALAHLAAFKRLDDQARDLAASTNAALVGAQFDFANQDLKIARLAAEKLQKDVALARSQSRAQRTLLSTVLAAGGIVFALVLVGFFAMRRSRNAVRDANGRLETTNSALERALNAKSQFLATTSHEIRTPLNGILGMTQVLLADATLGPTVRGRVELVHGAGETMRALVDDILDLAKMETGRISVDKQPLDLRRLIDETVRLWRAEAQTKGLTLTLDAPDLPPAILEDEGRLRQVLFNLMSNAIKFTDRGGVSLRIRREDARLVFAVSDSGIGIAAADHARVFEPFTQVDGGMTRRHAGTGLGLAICRDVARALGGEVELESRPGEGSTFTLRLPLVEAEGQAGVAEAPAGERERATTLAQARLLVVEPNPLARSILRAVLQAEAAQVEVAADRTAAEAALAVAEWDHLLVAGEALGADPAAAAAALHALREASGDAGVSLLLTQPPAELSAALLRAGARQALSRPIASEALVRALREAVAAAPDGAGALPAAAVAA